MTDESAEGFHTWVNPLYIVEHATLVYGNRPGTSFDKTKLVDTLRKIEEIAQESGVSETTTNDELKAMIAQGQIKDTKVQVQTDNGSVVEVTVPASKIRRINAKVIDALDHGYIPVAGTKNVSSTEIRKNIASNESIASHVGEKVEEVIRKHGLYKPVNM